MATEVIHTIKTSGGNYTSLSAWESAQQRNLVTADEIAVAECYSGAFTDSVTLTGWTTSDANHIAIRHASGHLHGFVMTASSGSCVIMGSDIYARIKGLHLKGIGSHSHGVTFSNTLGAAHLRLSHCRLQGTGGHHTQRGVGGSPGVSGSTARIFNCFIYDWTRDSGTTQSGGIIAVNGNITIHASNNTIDNCRHGIQRQLGTLNAKNNVCQSSQAADYDGTLGTTATNISKDATSPQTGLRNITLAFANAAADDYHLAAGDTAAQGVGTDLSADADLAFSDDIDGEARPAGDWDIGADQFVAPPAGGVPSGLGLLGVGV